MNESIIPGIVIGVIVAVASGYVSHVLRKGEMKDLWAEEERRRKSDRRREIWERELTIVADTVDALVEVVDAMEYSAAARLGADARIQLGRQAHLLVGRANVRTLSLEDQVLHERLHRLVQVYSRWIDLVNLSTAEPYEGTEEEFQVVQEEVRRAGAEVLRRTREVLEEV